MQRKDAVRKEDVVQAVIIADTYDNTFRPVTDFPGLMPLVNKPLLEYSLRCLSSAKVDEAIVFCTSDTEDVKSFISNREWGRMSVTVVASDRCGSLGDAMRDLDAKALIRGDFILLGGNLVGNLELLPVLERHKSVTKKFMKTREKHQALLILSQSKLSQVSDKYNIALRDGVIEHEEYVKIVDEFKKYEILRKEIMNNFKLT